MKIFGYLDDIITNYFNWRLNMGLWNILIIPMELFIILFIIVNVKPWLYGRE